MVRFFFFKQRWRDGVGGLSLIGGGGGGDRVPRTVILSRRHTHERLIFMCARRVRTRGPSNGCAAPMAWRRVKKSFGLFAKHEEVFVADELRTPDVQHTHTHTQIPFRKGVG